MAWCHMVWNIAVISWDQLSPPSTLCSLLGGWGKRQKRPRCSAYLNHPCCVSSTNPKQNPTLTTLEEINFIPNKSSKLWQIQTSSMIRLFIYLLVVSLWPSALEMNFYLDELCFSFNMKISLSKKTPNPNQVFFRTYLSVIKILRLELM